MAFPSDSINGVLENVISEVRDYFSDVKGAYDSLQSDAQTAVIAGGLYSGAIVSRVAFLCVSRYSRKGFTSVRRELVNGIMGAIREVETGKFIAVYGAKGVGKTVAVNTALRSFSSISVSVRPGSPSDEIENKIRTEIVSEKVPNFLSNLFPWRTVVWFHHFLTFGQPLVAVIHLDQMDTTNPIPLSATDFGSAAKALSEATRGKLVVLIDDASDDALTDFKEKNQAKEFLVDYMSPSEIVEMRKYYPKLSFLATTSALADVLLACESVLGGDSLSWTELNDKLPPALSDNIPVYHKVVLDFLREQVNDNVKNKRNMLSAFRLKMAEDVLFSSRPAKIADYSSQLSAALLQFRLRPDGSSPASITLTPGLPEDLVEVIPLPNTVLRKRDDMYFPHTPGMAFILRHQIEAKVTANDLLALVAKENRSPWSRASAQKDEKLQ